MSFGKIEIVGLIVLFIVLLFVGGKKLPELARGFGESIKEIRKGFETDIKSNDNEKTA
jgi:sec-independent protein translocase protein TatA